MTAAPTPAPVAVEMVEVSVTLASETVATFQGARVVQFISAMGRALGVDADRITVKSIAPVNVNPVRRRLNEAADVPGGSDMKLGIVVHVQIKLVAHTETVSVLAVMESAGFKKSLVEKMGSAGLAVRGAAALLLCCAAAVLLCCCAAAAAYPPVPWHAHSPANVPPAPRAFAHPPQVTANDLDMTNPTTATIGADGKKQTTAVDGKGLVTAVSAVCGVLGSLLLARFIKRRIDQRKAFTYKQQTTESAPMNAANPAVGGSVDTVAVVDHNSYDAGTV